MQELNKKINLYLDKKRDIFPRFYFVSNDELISILANSSNPVMIQQFISKMFENISKLEFEDKSNDIGVRDNLVVTSLISREGE